MCGASVNSSAQWLPDPPAAVHHPAACPCCRPWLCTSCVCARYVGPGAKQVQALQDLGQAAPLEGEDITHLKNRLAAGAAEALELQLR